MNAKKPLRGAELSRLYPEPKHYDQLQSERREIEAIKEHSLPGHLMLRASLLLTGVLVSLLLMPWIGALLLTSFGLITGVCGIFALGLSAVALVRQSSSHLITVFEMHGRSGRAVISIYWACIGLGIIAAEPVFRWTHYLLDNPWPVVGIAALLSALIAAVATYAKI